jgi:cytochrome oxidase Cu insertion factor (SCO1/SenC/PrrC family)
MAARTWFGWLVGGVLAAFAGLGALHLPVDLSPFGGGGLVPGTPAPGFTLVDAATLKPVALSSERGHPVVLAFVDVAAPSARVPAAVIHEAYRRLDAEARDVAWIVVDTDPWPVSMTRVADWARARHLAPPVTVVTGSLAELDAVWQSYGISVGIIGGRPAYTAGVYVLSPDLTEMSAMALNLSWGPRAIAAAGDQIARAVRDADKPS